MRFAASKTENILTMRSKSLYTKVGLFFIALYIFYRAVSLSVDTNYSKNDVSKSSGDVTSGHRLSEVLLLRQERVDASCCGAPNRKKMVVSPFSSTCERRKNCERLGTVYGERVLPFNICGLPLNPTIFSFGCGEDISFDVAFAATYNATMFMFDPTPRAAVHVKSVLKAIETKQVPHKGSRKDTYIAIDNTEHEISAQFDAQTWFHNVVSSSVERNQFKFEETALGDKDGQMSFVEPVVGVSHFLSASGVTKKGKGKVTVPVHTLQTLMFNAKLETVDIMKIDIEGYEIRVIPQLIALLHTWPKTKWPKALLFDMDSMLPLHPMADFEGGRRMVKMIQESGYSIYAGDETHPDYTFILDAEMMDCSKE